ncbi:MAG: cytochrome c biogenesis protein CcsA, partial [Planctomycetaceae bacterium]
VFQGRIEPIDTLARNSLRIISDRQTFIDGDGRRQPAIRWLLDVIAKPEIAAEHRVFRIEYPEVLSALELEARKGFRYSYAELEAHKAEIAKEARLARAHESALLSVYQKKMVELEGKLGLQEMLVRSFARPKLRSEPEYRNVDLRMALQEQDLLDQQMPPLAIPPHDNVDAWTTFARAGLRDASQPGSGESTTVPAALSSWQAIFEAYAGDDAQRFNGEVAGYLASLEAGSNAGVDLARTNFEAAFNNFEPFYQACVLYVISFLLTAVSWLVWSRPLNRAAFWAVAFTFTLHTVAVLARIYISGRPPVTNLYSSAVFIGWGSVLLGLLLESVYRIGIGNVIASVAGFVTLLIAHFLAGGGDTLAVLQAVLDTQFWLATHVVCITLGYATTYVAGLLGILYIVRGVLTPTLQPSTGKDLSRMIYGTLCFAIFFSFVGTVLGGLWADDSWGRFWGWDPKENGALMIVLWNALVLHARWGRLVQDRGLAVLAVAGNIAVSWSWFGVNELGVGLHSYGFTEGVLKSLALFIASQLVIIAIGLLPLKWWWSQRRHSAAA